eukprot:1159158-Pelagomonas_calceolata.AAC.5
MTYDTRRGWYSLLLFPKILGTFEFLLTRAGRAAVPCSCNLAHTPNGHLVCKCAAGFAHSLHAVAEHSLPVPAAGLDGCTCATQQLLCCLYAQCLAPRLCCCSCSRLLLPRLRPAAAAAPGRAAQLTLVMVVVGMAGAEGAPDGPPNAAGEPPEAGAWLRGIRAPAGKPAWWGWPGMA